MAMVLPNMDSPCQDCTERTVGCHATCEKYTEFRKKRSKVVRKLKEARKAEYIAREYTIEAVYRAQDKRKHMEKRR